MAKPQLGKQLCQQCEYPVGRKRHEDLHHLHHDHFHIAEKAGDAAARLARAGDGVANQQGKHDDLQHLAIGHGLDRVGGENIDQYIHKWRRRGRLKAPRYGHIHALTRGDNQGEQQRQRYGDRRGGQVEPESLDGDGSHAGAVAEGAGAANQRDQHQRHYQHLEGRDENAPHRVQQAAHQALLDKHAQAIGQAGHMAQSVEQGTRQDARHHGGENAIGQAHYAQAPSKQPVAARPASVSHPADTNRATVQAMRMLFPHRLPAPRG